MAAVHGLVLTIPHFSTSNSNVLYRPIYSIGGNHVETYPPEKDDEFIPWTGGCRGWIEEHGSYILVMDMANYCVELIKRPDYKIYGAERLPSPEGIQPPIGTKAKCRVIRSRSPSDFHVIFTGNCELFDLNACDKIWTHFFRKKMHQFIARRRQATPRQVEQEIRDSYSFRTAEEVFHGVSHILTRFMMYTQHPSNIIARKVIGEKKYKPGDLVVVIKPSLVGAEAKKAYRAVVVEPVIVHVNMFETNQDSYLVYLLDIGEKRVVDKGQLAPLPRPFITFRPLAVACQLTRLLPNPNEGSAEWSATAETATYEVFKSYGGCFFAKLYSRTPSKPCPAWLQLPNKFAAAAPFWVDLSDLERKEDVAELLSKKKVGVIALMGSSDAAFGDRDGDRDPEEKEGQEKERKSVAELRKYFEKM